jgi:hypothetical protein
MISGFRGSGKDTLGSQIIMNWLNFKRYAFADKLKDIIAEKYGFDRDLADIRNEKDKPRDEYYGKSIRDLGREEWLKIKEGNPTMFSETVARNIKSDIEMDPDTNFVITDFRYEFDYDNLVKHFGEDGIRTVRISRNGIDLPDEQREPEEYALKGFPFDIHIANNGTYEQLWDTFCDKFKHQVI